MSRDQTTTLRLLGYLRPYSAAILISLWLLLLARVAEVAVPILLGRAVDMAFVLEDGSWKRLLDLCLSVGALLLISYVLDGIKTVIKSWVGQKAILALRTDLFSILLHRTATFFDHNKVGVLMSRCIHDVDQVNRMLTDTLIPMMGSACMLVGILIAVFFVDVRLAMMLLAVFPLIALFTIWFRKRQRMIYEQVRKALAKLNGIVQEQLMGSSVLRLFGQQTRERAHFSDANSEHCQASVRSGRTFSLFFAGVDFLQSLLLICLFALLVLTTPAGEEFRAGTYFAFSLYILMLFRPLADLAERYNTVQSAMASADQIFDLIDQPYEEEDVAAGEQLESIQSLEFDDVWFRYSDGPWVLQGVSFRLEQGEKIALVGATGAGKSTLFYLLLRLYPLEKGRILINGRDHRHYSLQSIRRQIVSVLQDPQLFSGTVGDNVRLFGQIELSPDVKAEVTDLLDGVSWDQEVGIGGQNLSIGQRQLVAFARAAAGGGSLLVLDEATAHVDSASELLVQEALDDLLQDKTSLVIAHRLSTVRQADRIVVLHNGRVSELGTHEQLMELGGLYEKLYRLQMP